MDRQKISDTSAFVLLLSKDMHKDRITKTYLSKLNLDDGKNLYEKSKMFWPYYDEVIKNRKHCIYNLVKNAIVDEGIKQVIIFGAGLDTLSLQIFSMQKNCTVFDLDITNMDIKEKIINSLDCNVKKYIKCIAANLQESDITSRLTKHGWSKEIPTLLIFEGISYYLPSEITWNIISSFKSASCRNKVIFEYLLPNKEIGKLALPIVNHVFHSITTHAKIDKITRYSSNEVALQIKKRDGKISSTHNLKTMEKDRISHNDIFQEDKNSWIEICQFYL